MRERNHLATSLRISEQAQKSAAVDETDDAEAAGNLAIRHAVRQGLYDLYPNSDIPDALCHPESALIVLATLAEAGFNVTRIQEND